ncbi:MAG: hypothetical protein MJE68_14700 [Proteobacteria bacterium]|nr:hypothetical protein [Pseudomonadota bacterium]
MYVDSFEITSSPDSVQQYVSIEYVQQVQVDREKEIVIRELESIHEDASVEEVFCSDLSPESMYTISYHNNIIPGAYVIIILS